MKIEHVRLFLRVAVTKNISQAGKELDLSAAVASLQLKRLEESLGVRLLHRSTRKISLTEDGESFLPHAEALVESFESARESVGAGRIVPRGKLRITASASFARLHVVPLLGSFLQRYPELSVDMYLSDRLVDLVEGGFDLAIRDTELKDSAYIARRLAPVRRVVCAAPAYLNAYGTPKAPADLLQHHCVTMMGLEQWCFQTPEGERSYQVSGPFRTDNGEAARDACLAGMGITISSTWCCYRELKQGQLVEILSDYPLISDTALWAVYPSSRLLAPKVRACIDFLREAYANTDW